MRATWKKKKKRESKEIKVKAQSEHENLQQECCSPALDSD